MGSHCDAESEAGVYQTPQSALADIAKIFASPAGSHLAGNSGSIRTFCGQEFGFETPVFRRGLDAAPYAEIAIQQYLQRYQ
jgi:hypothetical protein